MDPETGGNRPSDHGKAVGQLSEAHSLLQDLRNEISQHPKLEDAILKLETALNILTTKSGGML